MRKSEACFPGADRIARTCHCERSDAIQGNAHLRPCGLLAMTGFAGQPKGYIITFAVMSISRHSHGDAPHEPATVSLSILRLSAWERLAAAAVLIALMWGAVYWAIA